MRNYGKVAAGFWKKGSGRKLRGKPKAQTLALYLMTCEQGSMSGLFHLPLPIMAYETGLTPQDAEGALAVLAQPEVDLAYYDQEAELVWVPGTALHQVGPELKAGDKRRHGLLQEVLRVGAHAFAAAFWSRYGASYQLGPMPAELARCGEYAQRKDLPIEADPSSMDLGSQYINKTKQSNSSPGHAPSEAPSKELAPDSAPAEDDPAPAPTAGKRGGRKPRTYMTPEWQPRVEDTQELVTARLDVASVTADFRDYWLREGKMMADWNAAYRQNTRKVLATDWLRTRYLRPTPVASPASSGRVVGQAAPDAVPAPPGLAERMRAWSRGENADLADAAPTPGADAVSSRAATQPAAGAQNAAGGPASAADGGTAGAGSEA